MDSEEPRSAEDYLGHMLEALDRIETYIEGLTRESFLDSDITQDAVIRNLEIIGEASRNLLQKFPQFVAAHSELPLISAYKMRNMLSHGYFAVDLGVVWKTVHHDLPGLRQQLQNVVRSAPRRSEASAAVERWKAQYHSAGQLTPEEQRRKAVENWLKLRSGDQSVAPEPAGTEPNTERETRRENADESLSLERQRNRRPKDDAEL